MHAHSLTLAPAVVLQTHSCSWCQSQTHSSQRLSAVSAGGMYAHTHPSHAHSLSWYMYVLSSPQDTKTILAANSQGHIEVRSCHALFGCYSPQTLLLTTIGAEDDLLD